MALSRTTRRVATDAVLGLGVRQIVRLDAVQGQAVLKQEEVGRTYRRTTPIRLGPPRMYGVVAAGPYPSTQAQEAEAEREALSLLPSGRALAKSRRGAKMARSCSCPPPPRSHWPSARSSTSCADRRTDTHWHRRCHWPARDAITAASARDFCNHCHYRLADQLQRMPLQHVLHTDAFAARVRRRAFERTVTASL